MTTMQTPAGAQSSIYSDGNSFDMWHDYMNLGRLLERLCDRREADLRDTKGPQKEAAGRWSHIQTFKKSAETSSVSSLSDTSSSGTNSSDFCRFCKQNGESPRVYRSHKLKADDGRVICPILWNYTCPICEATGDRAHTRRYCPQAQQQGAAKTPPGSGFR
uniref:nanos homolog 2-like n=1 Tax=Scatophagus argus TaxID=75038 RepID=UPI001ED7F619|nr:nanos homolog 2-like [Scatophagus argus]